MSNKAFIEGLRYLEQDWNFGEGEMISNNVINRALKIYHFWNDDESLEVFPDVNGIICLSMCNNNCFLDIEVFENTYYLTFEIGVGENFSSYELGSCTTFECVKDRIKWFRDIYKNAYLINWEKFPYNSKDLLSTFKN